jgi:hypothetical protein
MPRHALNGLKRVTFGKLSLPWSHQLIIFRTPKEVVHTITRTYGMKPLVPHSRQAEIQVVFNQLKKKHTKIQHILSDNVPVFLPCLPVFFLCYCYFVLFFLTVLSRFRLQSLSLLSQHQLELVCLDLLMLYSFV